MVEKGFSSWARQKGLKYIFQTFVVESRSYTRSSVFTHDDKIVNGAPILHCNDYIYIELICLFVHDYSLKVKLI